MTDCCSNTASELEKLKAEQSRTLKAVLAINLVMFAIEFSAGLIAASTALIADSLDMLGDALVYGFSLYVVARNTRWKAISALLKASIMALFGVLVLAQAAYKFIHPQTPSYELIGLIGLLALMANMACLLMLWKHRSEDINMRSVWLCSRNDIIANLSVLGAALGVWLTQTQWPDLIIGLAIAALFLHSALGIYKEAAMTLRAPTQS